MSDAVSDDIARDRVGFVEYLVDAGRATRETVLAELPTLSRSCYEAIHTGTPDTEHEIWQNWPVRRSKIPDPFGPARAAEHATAAAAYYWLSDLYNRAPLDPSEGRKVDGHEQVIQHGRFYEEDSYPAPEVFAAAGLVRRFRPG